MATDCTSLQYGCTQIYCQSIVDPGSLYLAANPTGSGGIALNCNFTTIQYRQPKCNYAAGVDPNAGADDDSDYCVGSRWLNLFNFKMWICVDNTVGAAVWVPWLRWQSAAQWQPTTGQFAVLMVDSNFGVDGEYRRVLVSNPGIGAQLILSPQHTELPDGAIVLGIYGTPPGGDQRGASAIDLQNVRSDAAQVASGAHSFIAGGANNTASGYGAHAEGEWSEAIGESSHVEGFADAASSKIANATGAHLEGYALTGGVMTASAFGAHAEGAAIGNVGGLASTILAAGIGAHAEGYALGGGEIDATGLGAHAGGCASGGLISAPDVGAQAAGYALSGTTGALFASGAGTHAEGYANSGTINAGGGGPSGGGPGLGAHAEGNAQAGATISAAQPGAHAEGSAVGRASLSSVSYILANATGAHAEGYATLGGGSAGQVQALAEGCHAEGAALGGAIEAGVSPGVGTGAHAEGYATAGGSIGAQQNGAHAGGGANGANSFVLAKGVGALAHGSAVNGGIINAKDEGCVAFGYANGNGPEASGDADGVGAGILANANAARANSHATDASGVPTSSRNPPPTPAAAPAIRGANSWFVSLARAALLFVVAYALAVTRTDAAQPAEERHSDNVTESVPDEPTSVTLADGTVVQLETYGDSYEGYEWRPAIMADKAETLVDTRKVRSRGFRWAPYCGDICLDVKRGKMYWKDSGGSYPETSHIQRANLDGSAPETILGREIGVHGLSLDLAKRKVYCCGGAVLCVDVDGKHAHAVVEKVLHSGGTAVDGDERKLYYGMDHDIICRDLGNGEERRLAKAVLPPPHALALDQKARHLYWACAASAWIARVSLDGGAPEFVIESPIGTASISAIALDTDAGKLYWVDKARGHLRRSNLDGSHVEEIVIGGVNVYGVAVDPDGGKVYWTEYRSFAGGVYGLVRRTRVPDPPKPTTLPAPPLVKSIAPEAGPVGAAIVLTGRHLSETEKVSFVGVENGQHVDARFEVVDENTLKVAVPPLEGAFTGAAIIVQSPGGVTITVPKNAKSVSAERPVVADRFDASRPLAYVVLPGAQLANLEKSVAFVERGAIVVSGALGANVLFLRNGSITGVKSPPNLIVYHEPFVCIGHRESPAKGVRYVPVPAIRPSFIDKLFEYERP